MDLLIIMGLGALGALMIITEIVNFVTAVGGFIGLVIYALNQKKKGKKVHPMIIVFIITLPIYALISAIFLLPVFI